MKQRLFIILLALLLSLAACGQSAEEEPVDTSSEPGVVTVFKSPT